MCAPMIFRLRGGATVAEARRAVDSFCKAMYKEDGEMAARAEMVFSKGGERFTTSSHGQVWKFPGKGGGEGKEAAAPDESAVIADLVQDEKVHLKFTWRLEDLAKLDARRMKPEELPVAAATPGGGALQLLDCIRKYSEREQLDETETWYCNKCKDHVRAFKELAIWRAPPILIIQLKRFVFKKNGFREKIDTHVDFPLEGLDISEFVTSPTSSQNAIYDCYAVSNHFGGLGGGHYTAHALNGGEWCTFDDSRVTTNIDPSTVITSAAYCLYYKLRDWTADLGGLGGGSGDDDSEGGAVSREMDNFKLDEKGGDSDDMRVEVSLNGGIDVMGHGAEPQSADGGYEGDDDQPTAPTTPSHDAMSRDEF